MRAWKITIWCETDDDVTLSDLSEAVNRADDLPLNSQWQVEEVLQG